MKLHELFLSDFIDCSVDDNYKALPSPEAWAELQAEWSQLVGEIENVYFIRLLKELILLESKMIKLASFLKLLADFYDEDIVKKVNKLGIPLRGYKEETKNEDIRFADGFYRQWAIQLEQKNKELSNLQSKNDSKITRIHFDDLIIEVSKYVGYAIKENEISTQKFGLLLNRLKTHNENGQYRKNR